MNELPEQYAARIRQIQPDLEVRSIRINQEGLVNDVIILNEEIVFRFAKDELGAKILAAELKVLSAIQGHVSLAIPAPIYQGEDVIAYPLLRGETLSREILIGLSASGRELVADQIAVFLHQLHQIPTMEWLPSTSAPVTYEAWSSIRDEVQVKVYPMLMAHQVEWANRLFEGIMDDRENFEYQPCLIHGDLGSYHILFDRSAGRVNGIIDFGVAGIGDPAMDFGNLLQVYGETFVSLLLEGYPKASAWMKRARFYAQAIELEWVLSGLTSGELFWYFAHLGGARDIYR